MFRLIMMIAVLVIPAVCVADTIHVPADQPPGEIGVRAVQHRVRDVANGHDLAGDDAAPDRGDLVLPFQEQPLEGPRPDPRRLQRPEDYVQRDPVGGVIDDQAEHRDKNEGQHYDPEILVNKILHFRHSNISKIG